MRPAIRARLLEAGDKRSLLPLRVALLGESAAAGWLYAPEITPARMLAAELERACGRRLFELIDLTAIDATAEELVEIAEASLALTPDLLVVFAGNNWPARLPLAPEAARADYRELAERWREHGFGGVAAAIAERTLAGTERALGALVALCEGSGTELLLVVPEVNLLDWQRPRPVSWLPGDGVDRWHALVARAQAALAARDFRAVADAAESLLRLDQGLCPSSHRLRGLAAQGLGDAAACVSACRAEVDARSFDNYPCMPGATPAVQDAIRRCAHARELGLVDLPRIFAEACAGRAPGRRLFLDYCHLTLEGMLLAVRAIAAEVLRLTDPSSPAQLATGPAALQAPRELDARAKLLAGVCAAHWSGQEGEPLGPYWFEQALAASPAIAAEMRELLASRAVPPELMHLSASEQALERPDDPAGRRMRQLANLDAQVVEWLFAALERAGHTAGRAELIARLIEVHAPGDTRRDLAAPAYQAEPFRQPLHAASALGPEPALYQRSLWPHTQLTLLADGESALSLELTARLPQDAGPREGTLGLLLDDEAVCELALAERWTTHERVIERARLERGFHRLTLAWPAVGGAGERAMARVAERWQAGLPADTHPTFGELLALRVRRVRLP